jgi:hypothetical protein
MITADPPEAYGYTIFCDDIRVEVGGKLTYVGTYGGQMLVHGNFPFFMPKLALGIVYRQRDGKVVLPIKFWIFVPGDAEGKPSIVVEVPEQVAQSAIDSAKASADKLGIQEGFATVYAQFGLAPFNIVQPGLLKVRAVRGDQLISLGALRITHASEEAA